MAGDIAILVFAIDKLADVRPLEGWWALVFLSSSLLTCALGYVVGFPRTEQGDGLRPQRLVADLLAKPSEAMAGAMNDMIVASEVNCRVRLVKRIAVIVAIVLLFTGAIGVALARFNGMW